MNSGTWPKDCSEQSTLTDDQCANIAARIDQLDTSGYRNADGSFREDHGDVETQIQVLMDQLLPSLADTDRFHQWSLARCESSRQLPQPASAKTLIETIQKTDFVNEDSLTDLCDMLDTDLHSYIPLGMHIDHHYCLKPDLHQLVPEDHDVDWEDSREILPHSVLGINMIRNQAWTGNRRKDAGSDESSSSNESTGNDDSGFTFMQLGRVDYLSKAQRTACEKQNLNPTEMEWRDTGFVLVVAIEQDGTAGSPWLIYNFRPESDVDGDRVRLSQKGIRWGALRGDRAQRVAVKIAKSVRELNDKAVWNLTQSHDSLYSTQIVAAVISKESSNRGRILRQKIVDSSR
ncbi:hypothetical protein ACET3X_007792 [Alternaria dauci]|uniref:Uncharacterized protein n=1 Tax=Alternaria dauci TaxID=48095 RepID=A0ABR3UCZ3_9PLEO